MSGWKMPGERSEVPPPLRIASVAAILVAVQALISVGLPQGHVINPYAAFVGLIATVFSVYAALLALYGLSTRRPLLGCTRSYGVTVYGVVLLWIPFLFLVAPVAGPTFAQGVLVTLSVGSVSLAAREVRREARREIG